nr:hypothetical protein [uncultured Butyrivibrio sp.]
MLVRLKNLHDAACRDIRTLGRYPKYEKYSARNDALMKRIFTGLMEGRITVVAYKDPERKDFKCYHKSVKEVNSVQLSSGFFKDGNLYPTYDVQLLSFEEMQREGWPEGVWEVRYA